MNPAPMSRKRQAFPKQPLMKDVKQHKMTLSSILVQTKLTTMEDEKKKKTALPPRLLSWPKTRAPRNWLNVKVWFGINKDGQGAHLVKSPCLSDSVYKAHLVLYSFLSFLYLFFTITSIVPVCCNGKKSQLLDKRFWCG
jgi:hypothetical protein